MEIIHAWKEFESWLLENEPTIHAELREGASRADLDRLRASFVCEIPNSLITSLTLHDGEDFTAEFVFGGMRRLLSISDVLQQKGEYEQSARRRGTLDSVADIRTDGTVKAYDWSNSWIPILLDNSVIYCIDLVPEAKGNIGQVIIVDHESLRDQRAARSFDDFLVRGMSSRMSNGKWPFGSRSG